VGNPRSAGPFCHRKRSAMKILWNAGVGEDEHSAPSRAVPQAAAAPTGERVTGDLLQNAKRVHRTKRG
jgi:hypothetical protein